MVRSLAVPSERSARSLFVPRGTRALPCPDPGHDDSAIHHACSGDRYCDHDGWGGPGPGSAIAGNPYPPVLKTQADLCGICVETHHKEVLVLAMLGITPLDASIRRGQGAQRGARELGMGELRTETAAPPVRKHLNSSTPDPPRHTQGDPKSGPVHLPSLSSPSSVGSPRPASSQA